MSEKYRLTLHFAFVLSPSSFNSMATASRQTKICNTLGLHARPAMQFVDVANQFSSQRDRVFTAAKNRVKRMEKA